MFSENDMQDLLAAVRTWVSNVRENQDMLTKVSMLYTFMSEHTTELIYD